jgi:hypothetical protein
VDLVTFFEQEVGEITAVLPRDAGDECFLHVRAAREQEPRPLERKNKAHDGWLAVRLNVRIAVLQ